MNSEVPHYRPLGQSNHSAHFRSTYCVPRVRLGLEVQNETDTVPASRSSHSAWWTLIAASFLCTCSSRYPLMKAPMPRWQHIVGQMP
jgi:hypothetical protein